MALVKSFISICCSVVAAFFGLIAVPALWVSTRMSRVAKKVVR
jgi:hypothetical protein